MSHAPVTPPVSATKQALIDPIFAAWKQAVADGHRHHLASLRQLVKSKYLAATLAALGVNVAGADVETDGATLAQTAADAVRRGILAADDPAVADLLPVTA